MIPSSSPKSSSRRSIYPQNSTPSHNNEQIINENIKNVLPYFDKFYEPSSKDEIVKFKQELDQLFNQINPVLSVNEMLELVEVLIDKKDKKYPQLLIINAFNVAVDLLIEQNIKQKHAVDNEPDFSKINQIVAKYIKLFAHDEDASKASVGICFSTATFDAAAEPIIAIAEKLYANDDAQAIKLLEEASVALASIALAKCLANRRYKNSDIDNAIKGFLAAEPSTGQAGGVAQATDQRPSKRPRIAGQFSGGLIMTEPNNLMPESGNTDPTQPTELNHIPPGLPEIGSAIRIANTMTTGRNRSGKRTLISKETNPESSSNNQAQSFIDHLAKAKKLILPEETKLLLATIFTQIGKDSEGNFFTANNFINITKEILTENSMTKCINDFANNISSLKVLTRRKFSFGSISLILRGSGTKIKACLEAIETYESVFDHLYITLKFDNPNISRFLLHRGVGLPNVLKKIAESIKTLEELRNVRFEPIIITNIFLSLGSEKFIQMMDLLVAKKVDLIKLTTLGLKPEIVFSGMGNHNTDTKTNIITVYADNVELFENLINNWKYIPIELFSSIYNGILNNPIAYLNSLKETNDLLSTYKDKLQSLINSHIQPGVIFKNLEKLEPNVRIKIVQTCIDNIEVFRDLIKTFSSTPSIESEFLSEELNYDSEILIKSINNELIKTKDSAAYFNSLKEKIKEFETKVSNEPQHIKDTLSSVLKGRLENKTTSTIEDNLNLILTNIGSIKNWINQHYTVSKIITRLQWVSTNTKQKIMA